MNTLLQEFYRGKMQPGETVITEEQKKSMSIVIAYQNALLSMLDKKEADLCKKVWETMNELSAKDCEREYIHGMRMGAKLALALLNDKTA